MTVSLALRNHPSLPAATRSRLRKLAAKHGYRPDPTIAKLMHHLRTRRAHRVQSTLCGLCMQAAARSELDYDIGVLSGARARAESLGFGLDVIAIDGPGITPPQLQRVLLNRGISGILLLPMREPVDLSELIQWSRFSAVSATPSVYKPRLNEAMPDLFGNMLLLCQKLTERGCSRIGLVQVAEHDIRVKHRVLAPYLWHSFFGGGGSVPPLAIPRYDPDPGLLHVWLRQHRPDAIITNAEFTAARIHELLSARDRLRITLAATGVQSAATTHFMGILDNRAEVGAAAVEMLAAMVHRGECGLPETPRIVSIGGRFVMPKSTPQAG
jgi:DNA-binding LacI/PurR family transcriptional regulator